MEERREAERERTGWPLAAWLDMDARQRGVIKEERKETKWNRG